MKKTFSTIIKALLVLALVVTLLPQRVEAAQASLSGSSTVQAGSTVKLTLSVSGSSIMGVEATLSYDSNTLEFTNYDQQISGWTMVNNGDKFVLYGVDPISSSSVLSVTFRVKSGLSSDAALSASFKDVIVTDGTSETNLGTASWSGKVDAPLSSNCDLSSLTCADAALSPAFSSGTTSYSVTVPYEVEALNLSYKTADSSARVSVSGNTLEVGANTVTVTCTAANGAKKNYTISVTRQQDPNYKPNNDAMLRELTLDVGTLSPTFSPAVTEYVAYVPFETKSATLTGIARDEKALKVSEATMRLTAEGDNVMSITCTAEDGSTAETYTVHVYRMPKYEGIIPTMEIIDPNTPPPEPTYSIPMTVTLPVVGEMATTTAAIIGAAVLVLLLLLIGFLLGRIGRGGGYQDDDDEPTPPRPQRPTPPITESAKPHRNAPAQPPQMREPQKIAQKPVQKAAPQVQSAPAKVSDDTLTSPFVEDISAQMQQELQQRQEAETAAAVAKMLSEEKADPEAAADRKVKEMSLEDLLNDIHNM